MALYITAENQIHRLNILMENVAALALLPISQLTKLQTKGNWSIVQIVSHLSIAYGHYVSKIDDALAKAATVSYEKDAFKARALQRFIIAGQRPKGKTRKWKMKTLKRFEPPTMEVVADQAEIHMVFKEFQSAHQHLKEAILRGRDKDLSHMTIPSAIGPVVRFYLPEAFEFILSHAERHWVQIEEILDTGGQ